MSLPAELRVRCHAHSLDAAPAVRLVTDGASPLNVEPSIDAVLDAVGQIEAAL